MKILDVLVRDARHAIDWIEAAAMEAARAHDRVTRLEDERAQCKAEAIVRLMQTSNPLTGKQHSASSAEAVVETDAQYANYRSMQRDAEVERWRTLAAYEAAKRRVDLEVALVRDMARDE